MKTLSAILISMAVSGATLAWAAGPKDEEDIKFQIAAFDEAWNKGDLGALGAFFTDDATLITDDATLTDPMGMDFTGKAAIMEHFKFMLTGPMKGSKHKMAARRIQFVGPDVAVGDGSIEVGGMQAMPAVRAKGIAVFVKIKGKWLYASLRAFVHMPAVSPRK